MRISAMSSKKKDSMCKILYRTTLRFITKRSEGLQRSGEEKGKERQRQRKDSGRDSRRKGGNRLGGSREGEKRGRIEKGDRGGRNPPGQGKTSTRRKLLQRKTGNSKKQHNG